MLVYVAGGWFNDDQLDAVREMETALGDSMIDFHTPRLDNLWEPGMDQNIVVQENTDVMDDCTFILASTEGKDMGTLWECGYAYARGIPVVYYFKGKGNFNIMLAATATAVLQTYEDMQKYLDLVRSKGLQNIKYEGDME